MLIDVLDENGNMTGDKRTITDVHVEGLWHRSAHLWIINSRNDILLQKRSAHVVNFPLCLDISTAGHVDSGEDSLTTIIRECKEEIGLTIDASDIHYLTTIKNPGEDASPGKYNYEFDDIYILKRDVEIGSLTLDPQELAEVVYVSLEGFKEMVTSRDMSLVPHFAEYNIIIDYLEGK